MALRFKALKLKLHVGVFLFVQNKRKRRGENLTDNRSKRRACNAELRKAQKTENHYGVKYDVYNRADKLCYHRVERAACTLQDTLKRELAVNSEAQQHTKARVGNTHIDYFLIVRLYAEKRPHKEYSHKNEYNAADSFKEHTIHSRLVSGLKILLTERARQKRVHTNADTRSHRKHKALHRKRH